MANRNEYQKTYRKKKRDRGVCTYCSKPLASKSIFGCDEHISRAREYQRAVRGGFKKYLEMMEGKAKGEGA